MRQINIGDTVICSESGVTGEVIRFYTPTASEEQTMVKMTDGRKYHAPTRTWHKYRNGLTVNPVVFDIMAGASTGRDTWMLENPNANLEPKTPLEDLRININDEAALKQYNAVRSNLLKVYGVSEDKLKR